MFISSEKVRSMEEGLFNHRDRLSALEKWHRSFKNAVPEFGTGILLDAEIAEKREIIHCKEGGPITSTSKMIDEARGDAKKFMSDIVVKLKSIYDGESCGKTFVYFRKGGAPDCDYIVCDGTGVFTYWKRGKTSKDSQVKSKGK